MRNLTNTSNCETTVYINSNLSAILPLEENQSSFNNPITISLKGLNGLGTAGQIIKMNSLGSALEYGDDEGSNWTENGSNIYPKNVGQVLINTTSNSNNRNLLINGTGDIVGNLHFGNNNDIYIKALGQNMRNYAGYTAGNVGAEHLFYVKQSNSVATQIGSIRTGAITNIGNANVSSGNSQLNLYSASNQSVEIKNNDGGGVGGSPYLSFECYNDNSGQGTSDYYIKWVLEGSEKMRLSTTGLSNVSWKGSTISEIYGGTNQTIYSTGDILYSSASNALSKLPIGNTDQVLTVKSGIPSWEDTATPDLTTATNFGTAVQTGTIKMGNSSGNSYTANIELYVNSNLSIFNTSNVEVVRFSPATNTCDLSLFGGVLNNATIGANTQYLGTAITYNYGGTGLSNLTANKILQVNSNANGYNLVDMPTAITNNNQITNGAGYITISSVPTNNNQLINGAGYITSSSLPTQYWSKSSGVLSPLTSTDAIRSEASLGIRIGGSSDYTALDYNQSTNVFSLYNSTSNVNLFEYDADNGYINWSNQASARMNFKNYILHGDDTAYPSGVNMPFGTIGSIYALSGYMKFMTTDSITVSAYLGSPANTSSAIRCNSSSEIYFTGNKLLCDTITAASSRFRTNYSSSRCFLTNPSGTNTGVSFAGSFLAYHDNGTELHFNNPNSSSATSTSSNINFKYNGINRIQMTGSETEAMRFLRDNGGGQYAVMGRAGTFPSNMSFWSNMSVPGGTAFYIGGANSNNDAEGYFLTMNGNQIGISSPGDTGALNYYDEDGGSMRWQIDQTGSLNTFSDIRLKKDIIHYKNSNFEKYKQIRTVSYRQKIPKNINPHRLKKQSCIDKFNNLKYGVIAQEIYELYPELESSEGIREREVFYNRKDNWNNGVYEKEHNEWVKQKEEHECSKKTEDGNCCEYKEPEPPKEFNEEEPIKRFDYHRLNILTVGVVQDLIKENDTLKNELEGLKGIVNKLVNAPSFKNFKETIA